MKKNRQQYSGKVLQWIPCMIMVLIIFLSASAAQQIITLDKIEILQDTVDLQKADVVLAFDKTPHNFPVYAMTDPERIIIDCANTKVKKGIIPEKSPVSFIKNVVMTGRIIENLPNTRVEIFLKVNSFYKAHIDGKKIIVAVTQAGTVKKSISLFKAEEIKKDIPVIQSLDIAVMEEYCEIDLAFSDLPKAASVYKMESPPRIVMDFYNVFISDAFEKEVAVRPIEKISVVKKNIDLPYVGVIVHLEQSLEFHYEQLNGGMIVTIPFTTGKRSKRRKIFLISTGVILTGGVVTGILMGGDDSGGGAKDLGAPPDFPDQ